MRNPLASEVFNEEIANLIKRKFKSHRYTLDELTVRFDYEGEVSTADTGGILDRIASLHRRMLDGARLAAGDERQRSRRTSRRPSTASTQTSSSRTCRASSTTW
jgi:hypothetical protein